MIHKTEYKVDKGKCLKMYIGGISKSKISKYFKVHERVIKKILGDYKLSIRPRAWYSMGDRNPAWKDGRNYCKGYIYIYSPNHPNKTKHNWVSEHRLVMEKKIGRYLLRTEVVDHINGKRDDNRISNLRLFNSNAEHLGKTLKGKIPKWTREGKINIMNSHRNSLSKYIKIK